MIAYRTLEANDTNVVVKQAQGLQLAKSIFSAKTSDHATDDFAVNSWSTDDCLQRGDPSWCCFQTSGGKMTPFLSTKSSEINRQISPDAK